MTMKLQYCVCLLIVVQDCGIHLNHRYHCSSVTHVQVQTTCSSSVQALSMPSSVRLCCSILRWSRQVFLLPAALTKSHNKSVFHCSALCYRNAFRCKLSLDIFTRYWQYTLGRQWFDSVSWVWRGHLPIKKLSFQQSWKIFKESLWHNLLLLWLAWKT